MDIDGGNACCPPPSVDPWFTAQALSSPLGSLLRIDPIFPAGGSSAYAAPANHPFASDGACDLYLLTKRDRSIWPLAPIVPLPSLGSGALLTLTLAMVAIAWCQKLSNDL